MAFLVVFARLIQYDQSRHYQSPLVSSINSLFMKHITLCYLTFFLLLAFAHQQTLQHHTGIHSLLLSSLTQQTTHIHPFTITFDRPFPTTPDLLFSIAGFQGLPESGSAFVKARSKKVTTSDGQFEVEMEGLALAQISYFFLVRSQAAEMGLLFWDSQQSQGQISKGPSLDILERRFRKQPGQDQSLMESSKSVGLQLSGKEIRVLSSMTMLKSVYFSFGVTAAEVMSIVESATYPMSVAVNVILPVGYRLEDVPYFLVMSVRMEQRYEVGFSLESNTFKESDSLALGESRQERGGQDDFSGEEVLLVGLFRAEGKCPASRKIQVQNNNQELKIELRPQCSELAIVNTLWLKPIENMPTTGRLLQTCASGTMANYYNWTYLLTVTSTSSLKGGSTLTCMPCPIGCLTCRNVTGVSSSCWNAYCLSCAGQYNIAVRTDYSSCTNRQYCKCQNSGQYPQASTGNCQGCTSVISNCQTCSAHEWAGTFCTQCSSGYTPVGGNMPRSCNPCVVGCSVCASSTSCATCSATFVLSSGQCVCNTSQNLYYNSGTNTCTSCSTVIASCTSCTGSTGTTTVCASCAVGTFLSGGICVACTTYCTSCTSSSCLTCLDSTFIQSGTTCVCDATAEMFLSTTLNTCISCATLITNCVDCSGANTSSITCVSCIGGYYFDGTSCLQCTPYCSSCVNGTSCTNCTSPFIYTSSNGTCNCDTANNYMLNPTGTTCVLCSDYIPNCVTCTISPLACTDCADPYYVDGSNTCTQCPPGCPSCTVPTICDVACLTGYTGVDCTTCSACAICPGATGIAYCATCTGATCDSCEVGYFMDTGPTCTLCPSGCITCSNLTSCGSCALPFIFVSPNCVCNTALGQFYDGTTCTSSCGTVITGCLACASVDGLVTTCTSCTSGTYIAPDSLSCITCPTNSIACLNASVSTSCQPTFSLVSGVCVCDPFKQQFLDPYAGTCQACSYLLPDCTACATNGSLATGVECTACAAGFYIDATFNCSACPLTCLTCTISTCIDCVTGYSLINSTCSCDSSIQMFDTGSSCAPCYTFISTCSECTGTGPTNVTCLTCPSGTYMAAGNLSCIACPANCDSCDNTGCLLCVSGFNLTGTVCAFLDTCASFSGMDPNCLSCTVVNTTDNVTGVTTSADTCLSCQQGTFLFGGVSCVACPTTCATCSSYYTCLTCQPTYSLISGACSCNLYNNEVEYNGACVTCSAIIVGCEVCNDTVTPVVCTTALPTFVVSGGVVTACPTGCSTCLANSSCLTCLDGYAIDLVNAVCTPSPGCPALTFYDTFSSSCIGCSSSSCQSCLSATSCLTCSSTFSLVNSACVCDSTQGYFLSTETGLCELCGTYNSTTYGVFTANCQTCTVSANVSVGFECSSCSTGYYLVSGVCTACQTGCAKCTGAAACYQCQTGYVYSAGSCVCDTANNYFPNSTYPALCQLCSISNCVICTSLTACSTCATSYFLNYFGVCQMQVCGDGLVDGSEECDDGNTVNGDGCSSVCLIELYYLCNNPAPGQFNSLCYLDTDRFRIKASSQSSSCNFLSFTFELYGTQSFTHCDFVGFFSGSNISATYLDSSRNGNFLTYSYKLTQNVQGDTVAFVFDPYTLCVPDSYNFVVTTVYVTVDPNNNYPAIFYPEGTCDNQKEAEGLVSAVEYSSYGVLMLSALPCKIVGLQLFGVLQLSFLTLGSMDNVNVMLSPLKKIKGVNGFNLNVQEDSKSRLLAYTSERINSIDYKANFLRNVNVMLIVVGVIVLVALVLYVLTYCCKNCAPTLHKIAKRLFKEVLLTMILFNILNFSYSAGIHFKYAPKDDSLYGIGTFAAVLTLILPVLMAIGLECAEEEGFGEFKDKMKRGCLERAYFVVTIVYRMGVGLYLSMANEDDLSTLIVLALSIMFLIYNLVNLPFTQAYHNYRANICHLTQFVTLFVAMYYRSMMSNTSIQVTAYTYSPVYFEYVCIVISLVVSMIVLGYEIYLFVKNCCFSGKEQIKSEESIVAVENGGHHQTLENIGRESKVVFEGSEVDEEYA